MEIRQIPLSLVSPSPMNPRKTFDEDAIRELADNIEKQGLLQPITVRPIADKKQFVVVDGVADFYPEYEIICGERRYRAMSLLSDRWAAMDVVAPKGATYNRFAEIAAIVREMDDEEAFDAMITENLQRKDVDPMEEAFAFSQLIKKGKSVEDVALRFGKSIRFIQDRVKLNNLIPELMVAVKDDRMSISAAMIISKLSNDEQAKYAGQFRNNSQGYSKSTADSFTQSLFLKIENSLWYKSDDQADESFAGGCGVSCSECSFNTANHGCLFWDMKSKDVDRCTNRDKFQSKTFAYMQAEVEKLSDRLVKKGEKLEFGKTVIAVNGVQSWWSDESKKTRQQLLDQFKEYEIVDPFITFRSPVYYAVDDERTIKFLEDGEAYRVLQLMDNTATPMVKHSVWYVRSKDTGVNVDANGTPYQVNEILSQIKSNEYSLKSSLKVAGAEALNECTPSAESLTEQERGLLITCMLNNNFSLAEKVGVTMNISTDPTKLQSYIKQHPEKWAQMMRVWMFQQIHGVHANLRCAESMLDELGEKNCPELYKSKIDKATAKYNKTRAKDEKKLKELGYDLEGKPLSKTIHIELPQNADLQQQYKDMKAKHPDSILLFRVGDFYECIQDDAVKVSELLSITLTGGKKYKLAGFPHHALDSYLPRLIRAGVRVAICEELEKPKK